MKLVIGNKCYSSWSLRPWLLLRRLGMSFEEIVIPLSRADTTAKRKRYAATGTVPILLEDGVAIWESLAIIERVAELAPSGQVWPSDQKARALARVLSSEMHAGFACIRSCCPMNLGRRFAPLDRGQAVSTDLMRLEELFDMARQNVGHDDQFLFGEFGAVDAMFAPVCARIDGYGLPVTHATSRYVERILSMPEFIVWRDAALNESWIILDDEVDEVPIEEFRPQLWMNNSPRDATV